MAKAAFSKRKALFSSKVDINVRKKEVNCYIWGIGLYSTGTWILWEVDKQYLGSAETWCWGREDKISWSDCLRKDKVLHRVEERNILQTIQRRKANWIGNILCRNCLLKHIIEGKIEGKIEVMGRQGRRCKQLLDDLKEKRGYWKSKEETLDSTVCRTHLGRGYGPVVRQTVD